MHRISCFVLVVLVGSVSASILIPGAKPLSGVGAVGGDGGDHFGAMKARYAVWQGCHPGYNGLTEKQLAAGLKCQQMGIKDNDCYLSCFRYETGTVKKGKWNHETASVNMNAMWDQDHQEEAAKWYADTKKCVDEYEGKGNKWTIDHLGVCTNKDFEVYKTCVREARKCP